MSKLLVTKYRNFFVDEHTQIKKGDRLRIKDEESLRKVEDIYPHVSDYMMTRAGEVMTVKHVSGRYIYFQEMATKPNGLPYKWTWWMIDRKAGG